MHCLHAELELVRAERQQLRMAVDEALHALLAENERLRADAERYRWLRNPQNAYRDEWNYFGPYSNPREIDAVIDAARTGSR